MAQYDREIQFYNVIKIIKTDMDNDDGNICEIVNNKPLSKSDAEILCNGLNTDNIEQCIIYKIELQKNMDNENYD